MSELTDQLMERIDNYLTGNLSPIESTQFESEIASNLTLQNEVDFQRDVINSIKEHRRSQLKSRLNNLEVSSTSRWLSKASIGGIAAGITIATSSFFFYEYTKFNNNPTPIVQEKNIVYTYEQRTTETHKQLNDLDVTMSNNDISNTSNESENTPDISQNNFTEVVAPNLNINDSEEEQVSNNSLAVIENLESVNIISSGAAKVNVEFKGGRKLAYKFYDEKLFLFGKFNKAKPYEVIEIKTHFGKEFYLKFDSDFYTIKSEVVEKTPLFKIDNEKLIKKLSNLD